MKLWPFARQPEKRESSFTDALVSQIVASAAGSVSARPTATGALEACAGLVGRAFASAQVNARPVYARAVTPALLSLIGRELIRNGEAVFNLDVRAGRLALDPAADWDVTGSFQSDQWRYRLNLAGPSTLTTIANRPATGVAHFRYAIEPARPWRGLSPIQAAAIAGRLSAETAKALADESSGPRGHFLPVPNTDGQDSTVSDLKTDIATLRGSVAVVESMASNWQAGTPGDRPADWKTSRIGASPPPALVTLMDTATREVAAACGIPIALLAPNPTGTGSREGMRQFLFGTVSPLGRLVAAELTAKLETPVTLSWDELRASDISGRARAYKYLVDGGMAPEVAAAHCGLETTA